ncbi:MAG: helix-turn-helix domain-containing protein [Oligoflexia bacterium]|nr:helix-turn-helix domain-containing protein [Oligoflexia bacterium]
MHRRPGRTRKSESFLRGLGTLLREEMGAQGKSPDLVAHQVGIARSTLRAILRGESDPRLLTVDAIARDLGYSGIAELLVKKSGKPPPARKRIR